MKLYINKSINPYFNLAAEEYLLANAKDDVVMLWRNEPSVIIGKNQNAFAEINFDFVKEHGIKVARRMTGGGAVFHDLGNLNYTFISSAGGRMAEGIREGGLDFAYFTAPIISALREISLDASLSGRNDIVVATLDGERKISGNAQCVLNGATLHHGTLLFSAKLEKMLGALNVDKGKLKSKGIASVRSRVANIFDLMSEDVKEKLCDVSDFEKFLQDKLSKRFSAVAENLTDGVIREISLLAEKKYSTDEWNLRRFGSFSTEHCRRFDYGSVEARFDVESGRIRKISFGGDFFGELDIAELEKLLCGIEYSREAVCAVLSEAQVERFILGAVASDITDLLLASESVL